MPRRRTANELIDLGCEGPSPPAKTHPMEVFLDDLIEGTRLEPLRLLARLELLLERIKGEGKNQRCGGHEGCTARNRFANAPDLPLLLNARRNQIGQAVPVHCGCD